MMLTFINLLCSAKVKKTHPSFLLCVCPLQGALTPGEKTRVNADETNDFIISLGLKYTFNLFMQC